MRNAPLASSSAATSTSVLAAAAAGSGIRRPALAPRRQQPSRSVSVASIASGKAPSEIHPLYSKLKPRADYLLCDVADIEKTTKSASGSTEQPATAPSSCDAVALGHGFSSLCDFSPTLRQFRLRGSGDTVLYSREGAGCIDVTMGGDPHVMLHDSKVVGILPGGGGEGAGGAAAGAAGNAGNAVARLRPFGDRVLFRVQPDAAASLGSLALPDAARGKPVVGGVVVAVGPGRRAGAHAKRPDARSPVALERGDRVACLEGVGDELRTPQGDAYVVVREGDVLVSERG